MPKDITPKDNCLVILRYVKGVIHERLITIVDCEASNIWCRHLPFRDDIKGFLLFSQISLPTKFMFCTYLNLVLADKKSSVYRLHHFLHC